MNADKHRWLAAVMTVLPLVGVRVADALDAEHRLNGAAHAPEVAPAPVEPPCDRPPVAGDPEVERWFNRHTVEEWRPLAERWEEVKAAMTSPVEHLSLPLDYYPSGRIKARLRAEKAQVFLDSLIFSEGVVVEMLSEEGLPDGKLTAEGCLFDRKNKRGYCNGLVGVEKDGDHLKGKGMYFSFETQFIKIMADCEIRTCRMRSNFGRMW